MEIRKTQIKTKNRQDYLFSNNLIVNTKDFVSSLLKIYKLSFKSVFSFNIYYIKYTPTKNTNGVSIDRNDNDEDYLYLFFDDVDGHIKKNNGIKYLVLPFTDKNKEALKYKIKLWEKTKRQMKVINDDEPIEYKKDFMKIRFESDDDLP